MENKKVAKETITDKKEIPKKVKDIITRGKLKVLIVEDSKTIREILKTGLKYRGCYVVEAVNGEEGILKVSLDFKPDLVITDLMMPVMDGYEFIKEFRKGFEEYKEVPIIVLSVKNSKDDIMKAIKLGANDYVVKPFNMLSLIQKIQKLFEDKNK